MTSVLLSIAFIAFITGLTVSLPAWISAAHRIKGNLRLLGLAWAALFIGQGQMFAHEGIIGGGISAGVLYQIAWMLVGSSLLFIAFFKIRIRRTKGALITAALGLYALLGIAGAAFSPSPGLSLYKSGQIFLDVLLILLVLSELSRNNNSRTFLNLSYFLLALVLASAALGGVLWPEKAFKDILGAYTSVLNSVYPQVHANELGLLSAIMLIVGLRRTFEKNSGIFRVYWAGVTVLAGVVLFHAQSRTSLASSVLAIIVMAILIPRLRPFAITAASAGSILLAAVWVGGYQLQLSGGKLETYLRRGASDEQIETLSGRIVLWQRGWVMFQDSPIIGHGMDAGVRYGGVKYDIPFGTNMHSAHMQVLVNTGILGYSTWLVFVVGSAIVIWNPAWKMRKKINTEEGRLRLELVLVAFVILFRSFLGHVLVTHQLSFMVYFALFIASVTTAWVKKRDGNLKPKEHTAINNRVFLTTRNVQ